MRTIALSFFIVCLQASAQLAVRIGAAPAVTLSEADLATLPQVTAVMNDHGKQVTYQGVLMHDVLVKAGIDFGTGLHGKQLATYVLAKGKDGYEVVFALSAFDPTLQESGITIAEKREGQPLNEKEGPLRVVVPQDKRPARCLRMLQEVDVISLKN